MRVHLCPGGGANPSPEPSDASTLAALAAVGSGIALAARMVDAPTNYMHTDACVAEAEAVYEAVRAELVAEAAAGGHRGGTVRIKVIKGGELKEQGFGLLWGVGRLVGSKSVALRQLKLC